MKKYYFLTVIFILILACITVADAANYYVSLNGSDSHTGIIDQPFRTIRYAVSKAKPGDNIYVRGGDYRENSPGWDYGFIDGIKGTSSSPILVSAYQQETPIYSELVIKDSEWLVVDGFRIEGYQPLLDNWKDLPEVVIDAPNVGAIDPDENWSTRETKVRQKYATYMEIFDNFQDSWTAGVFIKNAHNCIIRNTEILKFTAGIDLEDSSSNNRIQHNKIHHTLMAVFTWGDSGLISAENNIISNNHFYQNFFSAVSFYRNAKGNIVENNLAEYNAIAHMDTHTGTSHNVFRNNTLLHAGYYSETMPGPGPSGIIIHSAGPGNVVEGNFIAYQVDATGNDGYGIITDHTNYQSIIRNNILYRNMGHGFASTSSGKNIVVHNQFIENGYNSSTPQFGIGMARDADVDHIIANNIFYKNKSGGMFFNGLLSQQEYVDYNLFYQPGTPIVDDRTKYYDLTSYQNATGFGIHSVMSDPLFLDPDNGDYHLSVHSPGIDAGYNSVVGLPTLDFDGDARILGDNVDIGADEYVAAGVSQGDVNGDGAIDLADVIVSLKVMSNMSTVALKSADLNNDGKIGMVEALELLHQLSL